MNKGKGIGKTGGRDDSNSPESVFNEHSPPYHPDRA